MKKHAYLISFLLLLLLAIPLAAQNTQDAKYAQAEKLFNEASQLLNEGTKESLEEAIRKFLEAAPLYHELNDTANEAVTFNQVGFTYSSLGETRKALDYFLQALPLLRAVGDSRNEASTLTNIGWIHDSFGEKQKALDYYAQALLLKRAIGDQSGEATTLNNIGFLHNSLGERHKALDYYNQALPLSHAVGDRPGEAATLTNIGRVYSSLGETQQALDYYTQALPLFHAVGDRRGEAVTLTNIGLVYADLGEKQKALDYYAQSLPLYRAVGDRGGEATALTNIGSVYDSLGEKQKAVDYLAQALPLYGAVGDRVGAATALTDICGVYNSLGERQKALKCLAQPLLLFHAVGDRAGEAATLNNIGGVYNLLGERQKALDYFSQSLSLRRAVGDRPGEALTLFNISVVERRTGNLTESLTDIEAALVILESLRTKIGSQELRSSYFATVQDYYGFYIELLMQLHKQRPSEGYDGKALQASERRRARSLLETLAEANADIRQGVDSKLLERERALQQHLNVAAQEQVKLLSGHHTEEQALAIAKEVDALTNEFGQTEVQIRQTSPRYASLTQPQPLTLKEIQTQVLDKDTLLLQYSLDADRSYLWAVTKDSITSYELPKRTEIEDTAREVYTLLTDTKKWSESSLNNRRGLSLNKSQSTASTISSSPEAIARLSQMLLAPAAAQLGKKRLVVVADGALQFIPFAALPVPNADNQSASSGQQTANAYQPLIAEHEIVSLPSVSTLAVLRNEVKGRQPAPKAFAVLADPVFERADRRLKKNGSRENIEGNQKPSSQAVTAVDAVATSRSGNRRGLGLALVKSATKSGVKETDLEIPRLPGTRKEAEQILSLVPATSSKQAFDFTANRATATSADLSQYRYVHFATHGFLNSQHPELSGILLSMFDEQGKPQDGFLRAHEVFNLKLPAELVVLSACQTGLGKEVKGEGLVSLTRGFMYAGSPRVVVSLWSVSDVGTAELMTRFYKGMLKEGLRPAQALQAAQLLMFKDKRFASPFYWAAFTLQGEWR